MIESLVGSNMLFYCIKRKLILEKKFCNCFDAVSVCSCAARSLECNKVQAGKPSRGAIEQAVWRKILPHAAVGGKGAVGTDSAKLMDAGVCHEHDMMFDVDVAGKVDVVDECDMILKNDIMGDMTKIHDVAVISDFR